MRSELEELLMAAGEAPPGQRIEYRDRIARHGESAVARLVDWLSMPVLAPFAVRTIAAAAHYGARIAAVAALKRAAREATSPHVRSDAEQLLDHLGVPRGRTGGTAPAGPRVKPSGHPDEIAEGQTFERRANIHALLGGNLRKGISHPAGADFLLLISDPEAGRVHGYRDSWLDGDTYRFFGEWHGKGDMTLTGGNRQILDYSPRLYLFRHAGKHLTYEGRFAYVSHAFEQATRQRVPYQAIVFELGRAPRLHPTRSA